MTERLPSDHDAVESHRVSLETVGRTSRPRCPLPPPLSVSAGDVIRLSLGGESAHAQVTETLAAALAVDGAFDNARLARAGDEGENRLRPWLEEQDLGPGDTVQIDVVTAGYAYGLRQPGERVIYDAVEPPADSLADIARDVER